jgi:hypothetical protein
MGQTDWGKNLEERGDFEKEEIQNLTPENSNPEISGDCLPTPIDSQIIGFE